MPVRTVHYKDGRYCIRTNGSNFYKDFTVEENPTATALNSVAANNKEKISDDSIDPGTKVKVHWCYSNYIEVVLNDKHEFWAKGD